MISTSQENNKKVVGLRRSIKFIKDAPSIVDPFTQEKKNKKTKTKTIPRKPCFSFYGDDIQKTFYKWYNDTDETETTRETEVLLKKEFFTDILNVGVWLGDDHICEAVFCMRKRINDQPNEFKNIVITDWVWYKMFNPEQVAKFKYDTECVPQTFFAYLDGFHPKFFGKSWYYNVTTIYSPFLVVEREHYIGLEINLVQSTIRVMDCLLGLHNPILMKRTQQFDHLGAVMKHLRLLGTRICLKTLQVAIVQYIPLSISNNLLLGQVWVIWKPNI